MGSRQARGGVLGMAALLVKTVGASRTSPILRGNWLLETLLGEKLPRPPRMCLSLPESELDTGGLTMRQITEKHRETCRRAPSVTTGSTPSASRWRPMMRLAAAARPTWADARSTPRSSCKDGTTFADIDGLRDYLLSQASRGFRASFLSEAARLSLGRSVQLSDKSLLDEMERQLNGNDQVFRPRSSPSIQSPQFRLRRGLASPLEQQPSE